MLGVTMLSGISTTIGLNYFTDYLTSAHGLKPSVFYDKLYKELVVKKQFKSAILNEKIGNLVDQLYQVVEDESVSKLEFDISPNFPMYLAPYIYVGFTIMLYPREFFSSVADYFADWLQDEKIRDLGKYLANIMIDLDYDPTTGRVFTTEYNWFGHFTNSKDLQQGLFEYTILDNKLKFIGTSELDVSDYTDYQDRDMRIKQFFYHRASNAARKKYAQQIVERVINEIKSQ
jgi:hypothetical protein